MMADAALLRSVMQELIDMNNPEHKCCTEHEYWFAGQASAAKLALLILGEDNG